jgi:hypothetical protein
MTDTNMTSEFMMYLNVTCVLALGMRRCNDALPFRTREVLRALS